METRGDGALGLRNIRATLQPFRARAKRVMHMKVANPVYRIPRPGSGSAIGLRLPSSSESDLHRRPV